MPGRAVGCESLFGRIKARLVLARVPANFGSGYVHELSKASYEMVGQRVLTVVPTLVDRNPAANVVRNMKELNESSVQVSVDFSRPQPVELVVGEHTRPVMHNSRCTVLRPQSASTYANL